MSQSPSPLSYQSTQIRPAAPNTLGIIGFVFVMLGLAGFCAPPAFLAGLVGTVLCGIAVFKLPRGLAIAGLIVGVVEMIVALIIVVVLGIILASGARTAVQNAQTATSAQHATTMSFAIDAYKRERGTLPETLNDMPPFGADGLDGFGNAIRYVPDLTAQTYKLFSNSWDGKPNTADDSTLTDTSIKPFSTTKIPTMAPARKPTPPPPFPTTEEAK